MRRIAIDFDEVLFPMSKQMNKHYEAKYKCELLPKKMKRYDYPWYYDISPDEAKYLVHSFYDSVYAIDAKPIQHSIEGIRKLSQKNKLYVVTGRQLYLGSIKTTENFLNTFYKNCFEDVIYTNSYSLYGPPTSKSQEMKKIGAECLIDDNVENCNLPSDFKYILFGNYPWNQEECLDRMLSWNDCYYLNEYF